MEINIDPMLKHKFDLMAKRVTGKDEQDNAIILTGDMGIGKTNASVGIAHYIAQITKREFGNKNIFFDMQRAVDYAISNKEKIIIFDEPAFGGLKTEWRTRVQVNLIKLLLTSRYKRHFLIFNLAKFHKFSDDIIEKATAMIHIYKRQNDDLTRRFLYIPNKNIPYLLSDYHRTKRKYYKKYSVLHGTMFGYVMPQLINMDQYNKEKDDAVLTIGKTKEQILRDKHFEALMRLRMRLCNKNLQFPIVNYTDLYTKLNLKEQHLSKWRSLAVRYPELNLEEEKKPVYRQKPKEIEPIHLPIPM